MPTASTVLSEEAVAEIEARANAATKPPWEQRFIGAKGFTVWALAITRTGSMQVAAFGHAEGFDKNNAEFTAHAREDIPALCQTVRGLRTENERLTKSLREAYDFYMGPHACGDFTCTCDQPKFCGICEIREATELTLARDFVETLPVVNCRLSAVEAERDRFSTLADERHDQLWEARRQRDEVARRLSKMEAERDELLNGWEATKIREMMTIAADSAVSDFHSRAIALCRAKADEWERGPRDQDDSAVFCDARLRAAAARELATELEGLE